MEAPKIQFSGAPCGQHGPYTFYKSFKYSNKTKMRILSLGEFFYVRVLEDAPVSIGELQLLWIDRNQTDHQLCSVRLYFAPENSPSGRLPNHGQDEILAEGEKVVLDLCHLVEWIVEEPVDWPYGRRAFYQPQAKNTSCSNLARVLTSSNCGFKFNERNSVSVKENPQESKTRAADVMILSYPQYCRYRCLIKRLESCKNLWLKNAVISAFGGFSIRNANLKIMFCRDIIEHPLLEDHEYRLDHLVPLLKGRRRKKLSIKQSSISDNDSDPERLVIDHSPLTTAPSSPEKCEQKIGQPQPASAPPAVSCPNSTTNQNNNQLPPKILKPEDCKISSTKEEEFLQNLFAFMRNYHRPIERLPTLGFKEVDLYLFYGYAHKFGGYEKVTQNRQWKQIYDMLGGNPLNTSAATCTRRIYEKFLLPFERFLNGEQNKPLPEPYTKPSSRQLISNYANGSPPPEEKPVIKVEEKPKPKKLNKTVQEILKQQREFSEEKKDMKDFYPVHEVKNDPFHSRVPPIRSDKVNDPPSRPSVIHSVPPKIEKVDSDCRKRNYPFNDDHLNAKSVKQTPTYAHSKVPPVLTKSLKPGDYIDQLRQAHQKSKQDHDENSVPLDLSLKSKPVNGNAHSAVPVIQPKIQPKSKESAFKSIESLSSSSQKPSTIQSAVISPNFPLPIVHPAFAHLAAAGVMPPQFSQPLFYPASSSAALPQVIPQLVHSQQAANAFLIPSIPLFPPQGLPHVNPPVSKR